MTALKITKDENDKVKIVEPYKNQKLVNIATFAQIYGIGKSKAYVLVNKKGFPCIKNGNRTLVLLSKVDEWLENNIGMEF